jgi:hypothetical protein
MIFGAALEQIPRKIRESFTANMLAWSERHRQYQYSRLIQAHLPQWITIGHKGKRLAITSASCALSSDLVAIQISVRLRAFAVASVPAQNYLHVWNVDPDRLSDREYLAVCISTAEGTA